MIHYTYERDYKSSRADGRFAESLPAWLEYLRRTSSLLSLPENLTKESFAAWQSEVKTTLFSLLALPEKADFEKPKCLSVVQREGYRTERWEFYPLPAFAVPVLMQIPDKARKENPVPLVLCFPGAIHSKEFVAGEPLLEKPAARFEKYPDRNRMGRYMAENGMASVVIDPISIGETAMRTEEGDHGCRCRDEMIYGLLEYGWSYPGLSVFQALCILEFCKTLPYIDASRIAVSAHSLGTETALPLALICNDIKAIVFNDFLCNQRTRYVAVTETDVTFAGKGRDMPHILPGKFKYFGYEDLCAAVAPKYLALNEGGAEEDLNKVRRAFAIAGAADHLSVSYYPKYSEASARPHKSEAVPMYGLSSETYFSYTGTDAPDHSFRKEPSLALLKKCFGL